MADSEPSSQDGSPKITYNNLVDALLDQSTPLSSKYLYRLSDLGGTELTDFNEVWPNLDMERRKGLLEDLEILVEANYLVSFDPVFQIGLTDEAPTVRQIAIRALWEAEDPDLIAPFLTILDNDASPSVRAQAAAGLGHFVFLGELGKIQERKLKSILDNLLQILKDDASPLVRQFVLESLGFSSHQKIPNLIEDAYDSGDEDWLASSLVAMGRSADDQWHPYVVDNLDHSDVKVRLTATQAAGKLAIPDAIPILFHLLDDEEDEIQMAAVWALSEIGGDDARDTLERLLDETEDGEAIELIENALDNLIFNEDLQEFNIMDFSQDDLEDNANNIQNEE
jgi:hypothetical protein